MGGGGLRGRGDGRRTADDQVGREGPWFEGHFDGLRNEADGEERRVERRREVRRGGQCQEPRVLVRTLLSTVHLLLATLSESPHK